jgi:hypothetical protein
MVSGTVVTMEVRWKRGNDRPESRGKPYYINRRLFVVSRLVNEEYFDDYVFSRLGSSAGRDLCFLPSLK